MKHNYLATYETINAIIVLYAREITQRIPEALVSAGKRFGEQHVGYVKAVAHLRRDGREQRANNTDPMQCQI